MSVISFSIRKFYSLFLSTGFIIGGLSSYTASLAGTLTDQPSSALPALFNGNSISDDGVLGKAAYSENNKMQSVLTPRIAIDASGNALAVWSMNDGTCYNIWFNRYTVSTGWGTAELIESEDSGDAVKPQIAIDPSGNALAVWVQSNGIRQHIWSNRYTAGLGWGVAAIIESKNGGDTDAPKVAFDGKGNALAVWHQWGEGTLNILANRYIVGTGWGTAVLIASNNTEVAFNPKVAFEASSGDFLAVWNQTEGSRRYSIWYNRYTEDSGWGKAALIERDKASDDARDMQVTIDSSSNVLAVWFDNGNTHSNRRLKKIR